MFWLCFQAVSACSHILTQVPQWVWPCFSAWSLHAILKAWSNIVDRLWNNLTISIPAHQPVIFVEPYGYFCPHSLLPFHIRWVATLMFLELCDFFFCVFFVEEKNLWPYFFSTSLGPEISGGLPAIPSGWLALSPPPSVFSNSSHL